MTLYFLIYWGDPSKKHNTYLLKDQGKQHLCLTRVRSPHCCTCSIFWRDFIFIGRCFYISTKTGAKHIKTIWPKIWTKKCFNSNGVIIFYAQFWYELVYSFRILSDVLNHHKNEILNVKFSKFIFYDFPKVSWSTLSI